MTNQDLINHWVQSSDRNFDTMMHNFRGGHNTWALYLGHLLVEKLFKAKYIQVTGKKDVPYIHRLLKLAKLCNIEVDDAMALKLAEIDTFNIEARYESYKQDFQERCTKNTPSNK